MTKPKTHLLCSSPADIVNNIVDTRERTYCGKPVKKVYRVSLSSHAIDCKGCLKNMGGVSV